ncbi:hypothetical protein D3C86_1593730 [compost metagenome]|jgi:hypothetical protein
MRYLSSTVLGDSAQQFFHKITFVAVCQLDQEDLTLGFARTNGEASEVEIWDGLACVILAIQCEQRIVLAIGLTFHHIREHEIFMNPHLLQLGP